MPTMTHRTTFALDKITARRLKKLAARWKVSQAEVVRRSVEQAEKQGAAEKPNPLAMLRAYHAKGGLDPARAKKWLEEIREDRQRWRDK